MSHWGPSLVYGLCLLTSAICAGLLVRSYRRSRQPLLLWSAACFTLLAVNNLLVCLDMLVLREIDLGAPRLAASVLAVGVLLYGFIWEVDR
ncbi:DUF5985 family protein [Brevundimonas sp.]|uniref:DUF5985 family protein n=1 Tax=Brevundimonas sp. TaxID=1871086 RepID=UPI002CE5FDD4|nr:DUF5985 family protein [Brevundimonas sp.]HWQ85347.1 DUF5985 family protein [Brevundimonas sp.]